MGTPPSILLIFICLRCLYCLCLLIQGRYEEAEECQCLKLGHKELRDLRIKSDTRVHLYKVRKFHIIKNIYNKRIRKKEENLQNVWLWLLSLRSLTNEDFNIFILKKKNTISMAIAQLKSSQP